MVLGWLQDDVVVNLELVWGIWNPKSWFVRNNDSGGDYLAKPLKGGSGGLCPPRVFWGGLGGLRFWGGLSARFCNNKITNHTYALAVERDICHRLAQWPRHLQERGVHQPRTHDPRTQGEKQFEGKKVLGGSGGGARKIWANIPQDDAL